MSARGHHALLLAGESLSANVSSLLHFDGANGSTSFVDEVGHAWTRLGSPVISNAQSKFGGTSGYFPGSNAALSAPYHADFDLLGGAFTIRGFIYHTATGDHRIFSLGGTTTDWGSTTNIHLLLQVDSGGKLTLAISNGTAAPISLNSSGVLVPLNAQTFFAVSVDASAARLYLGSSRVAQVSSPAIVRPSGNPVPCIGRISSQGASANDWRGYIDEFQVLKGVAAYNGTTITVPTAPFVYP